jgi:hypothetical protein
VVAELVFEKLSYKEGWGGEGSYKTLKDSELVGEVQGFRLDSSGQSLQGPQRQTQQWDMLKEREDGRHAMEFHLAPVVLVFCFCNLI